MTDRLAPNPPGAGISQSLGLVGASSQVQRPVHYLGSKGRILDVIQSIADRVDPARGRAIDLFSGSGVVSRHLSRNRPVVAVDIQEYSRILASALTAPFPFGTRAIEQCVDDAHEVLQVLAGSDLARAIKLEREAISCLADGDPGPYCDVIEHGSITALGVAGVEADAGYAASLIELEEGLRDFEIPLTITRYYGGVYFSYAQAAQIDALMQASRRFDCGAQRDTAMAAVLGATSDCVSSVGSHFAQPIRPRDRQGRPKLRALVALAERRRRDVIVAFRERLQAYSTTPPSAFETTAIRADYRDFLGAYCGDIGVIYADPPYTRDHYSRFYHVLETIARDDEPDLSLVTANGRRLPSRGLYRRERHQSPFCIRSQAANAFDSLLGQSRRFGAPMVVSYSPYSSGTAARPEPRLLTLDELAAIGSRYYREVDIASAGSFTHSKFNARHLNGAAHPEAEQFLVCKP